MQDPLYARLRPYNLERKQLTKNVTIAPLRMNFKAGKFVLLNPKVQTRLKSYLETLYPNDDPTLPSMFQVVTENQKDAILEKETKEAEQQRRADTLGLTLRELVAQDKEMGYSPSASSLQRAESLLNRKPSPLEELAEEMGIKKEETEVVAKEPVAPREEEELWGELQVDLKASAPAPKNQEEVLALLDGDAPVSSRG